MGRLKLWLYFQYSIYANNRQPETSYILTVAKYLHIWVVYVWSKSEIRTIMHSGFPDKQMNIDSFNDSLHKMINDYSQKKFFIRWILSYFVIMP